MKKKPFRCIHDFMSNKKSWTDSNENTLCWELTGNPSADALGSFNQTARAPSSIKETVYLASGRRISKELVDWLQKLKNQEASCKIPHFPGIHTLSAKHRHCPNFLIFDWFVILSILCFQKGFPIER